MTRGGPRFQRQHNINDFPRFEGPPMNTCPRFQNQFWGPPGGSGFRPYNRRDTHPIGENRPHWSFRGNNGSYRFQGPPGGPPGEPPGEPPGGPPGGSRRWNGHYASTPNSAAVAKRDHGKNFPKTKKGNGKTVSLARDDSTLAGNDCTEETKANKIIEDVLLKQQQNKQKKAGCCTDWLCQHKLEPRAKESAGKVCHERQNPFYEKGGSAAAQQVTKPNKGAKKKHADVGNKELPIGGTAPAEGGEVGSVVVKGSLRNLVQPTLRSQKRAIETLVRNAGHRPRRRLTATNEPTCSEAPETEAHEIESLLIEKGIVEGHACSSSSSSLSVPPAASASSAELGRGVVTASDAESCLRANLPLQSDLSSNDSNENAKNFDEMCKDLLHDSFDDALEVDDDEINNICFDLIQAQRQPCTAAPSNTPQDNKGQDGQLGKFADVCRGPKSPVGRDVAPACERAPATRECRQWSAREVASRPLQSAGHVGISEVEPPANSLAVNSLADTRFLCLGGDACVCEAQRSEPGPAPARMPPVCSKRCCPSTDEQVLLGDLLAPEKKTCSDERAHVDVPDDRSSSPGTVGVCAGGDDLRKRRRLGNPCGKGNGAPSSCEEDEGATEEFGGSNLQSGGSNLQSGGSNLQSGGSSLQSGGSNLQSGGSNLQSGGSNLQSGGSNLQSGGSNLQSGGSNLQCDPCELKLRRKELKSKLKFVDERLQHYQKMKEKILHEQEMLGEAAVPEGCRLDQQGNRPRDADAPIVAPITDHGIFPDKQCSFQPSKNVSLRSDLSFTYVGSIPSADDGCSAILDPLEPVMVLQAFPELRKDPSEAAATDEWDDCDFINIAPIQPTSLPAPRGIESTSLPCQPAPCADGLDEGELTATQALLSIDLDEPRGEPASTSGSSASCFSISAHNLSVLHVACDSKCFYSSSADKTIKSFCVKTGAERQSYVKHRSQVHLSVPRFDKLYTAGADKTIMVQSLQDGSLLSKMNFKFRVNCFCVVSKYLFVGLTSGHIKKLKVKTMVEVDEIQNAAIAVLYMAAAKVAMKSSLVVASQDNTISVFNVSNMLLLQTFHDHNHPLLDLKVLNEKIISLDQGASIFVHSLHDYTKVARIPVDAMATCLAVTANSIFIGTSKGIIDSFDFTPASQGTFGAGKQRRFYETNLNISTIASSRCNSKIVAGSVEGVVSLITVAKA